MKDNLRKLPRNGHSDFTYKSLKGKKGGSKENLNYSAKQERKGERKTQKWAPLKENRISRQQCKRNIHYLKKCESFNYPSLT